MISSILMEKRYKMDEHIHIFEKKFYFDEFMKKTIETDSCRCGLSENMRVHH